MDATFIKDALREKGIDLQVTVTLAGKYWVVEVKNDCSGEAVILNRFLSTQGIFKGNDLGLDGATLMADSVSRVLAAVDKVLPI